MAPDAPAARCTFTATVSTSWYFLLQYLGFAVAPGDELIYRFCAMGSTAGQKIHAGVQESYEGTQFGPITTFDLVADEWICVAVPFTATAGALDSKPGIWLGDASAGPVWLDDVDVQCQGACTAL